MRGVLFAILLCTLVGCGSAPNAPIAVYEHDEDTTVTGTEDARNTEAAIKSALGVEAVARSFRVMAGPTGQRTLVTVRLSPGVLGDAKYVRAKVNEIARHTYRSHLDRVDVDLGY